MRTRRAEHLLGYALELVVSALRGTRVALGRMIGDDEDENLRPPAAAESGAFRRGVRDAKARRAAASRGVRQAQTPPDAPGAKATRDPEALRRALATAPPLPASYGDDRLVLLARDPGTLFAYWDLTPGFDHPHGARATQLVLRIEDLTLLDFEAARPWRHHDLEIEGLVGSRYVEVAHAAGTYRAQLGWRHADGSFVGRVRSLTVTTPRADTPGHAPLRWMTVRVEGAGHRHAAADAPARLAVEEALAPRGAPGAATASADLYRYAPSSADLHRHAPSSADLHGRVPSSDTAGTDARAQHRRGR